MRDSQCVRMLLSIVIVSCLTVFSHAQSCLIATGEASCESKFPTGPGLNFYCEAGEICIDDPWHEGEKICPGIQKETRWLPEWDDDVDTGRAVNEGESGFQGNMTNRICKATRDCVCANEPATREKEMSIGRCSNAG